jgi:hypothetical protein
MRVDPFLDRMGSVYQPPCHARSDVMASFQGLQEHKLVGVTLGLPAMGAARLTISG